MPKPVFLVANHWVCCEIVPAVVSFLFKKDYVPIHLSLLMLNLILISYLFHAVMGMYSLSIPLGYIHNKLKLLYISRVSSDPDWQTIAVLWLRSIVWE